MHETPMENGAEEGTRESYVAEMMRWRERHTRGVIHEVWASLLLRNFRWELSTAHALTALLVTV